MSNSRSETVSRGRRLIFGILSRASTVRERRAVWAGKRSDPPRTPNTESRLRADTYCRRRRSSVVFRRCFLFSNEIEIWKRHTLYRAHESTPPRVLQQRGHGVRAPVGIPTLSPATTDSYSNRSRPRDWPPRGTHVSRPLVVTWFVKRSNGYTSSDEPGRRGPVRFHSFVTARLVVGVDGQTRRVQGAFYNQRGGFSNFFLPPYLYSPRSNRPPTHRSSTVIISTLPSWTSRGSSARHTRRNPHWTQNVQNALTSESEIVLRRSVNGRKGKRRSPGVSWNRHRRPKLGRQIESGGQRSVVQLSERSRNDSTRRGVVATKRRFIRSPRRVETDMGRARGTTR